MLLSSQVALGVNRRSHALLVVQDFIDEVLLRVHLQVFGRLLHLLNRPLGILDVHALRLLKHLLLLHLVNDFLEFVVVNLLQLLDSQSWLVVSIRTRQLFLGPSVLETRYLKESCFRLVLEEAIRHCFRSIGLYFFIHFNLLLSRLLNLLFDFQFIVFDLGWAVYLSSRASYFGILQELKHLGAYFLFLGLHGSDLVFLLDCGYLLDRG